MKTELDEVLQFIQDQGLSSKLEEHLKYLNQPPHVPTQEWYDMMYELAMDGINRNDRWLQEISDPEETLRRRVLEGKILVDRHDAVTDHLFVNPDDIEWFARMLDSEFGSQTDVFDTMMLWGAKILPSKFVEPGFLLLWSRRLWDNIESGRRSGPVDETVSIVCIRFNEKLRSMKMAIT